jgi:hypothetical protein
MNTRSLASRKALKRLLTLAAVAGFAAMGLGGSRAPGGQAVASRFLADWRPGGNTSGVRYLGDAACATAARVT